MVVLERLFNYNIGGILLCYIIALHIKLPRATSFKPCISCKQSSWVVIVTKTFSYCELALLLGGIMKGVKIGKRLDEKKWKRGENGGDRGIATCMYGTQVRT